ncbi:MAG TPA: transposase [Lentzea sp.]|nr:transposase [Lentzea sp.]HUQ59961.1 transposase [Lentzea sp.]
MRTSRYPTDLTDAQWAELDVLLPDPACLGGNGGQWEKHCRRLIVDAILYVVDNSIKWRALPADSPPRPTVFKRFTAWEKAGTPAAALRGSVCLGEVGCIRATPQRSHGRSKSRCHGIGPGHGCRRRNRSCVPRKQPPARTAFSAAVVLLCPVITQEDVRSPPDHPRRVVTCPLRTSRR